MVNINIAVPNYEPPPGPFKDTWGDLVNEHGEKLHFGKLTYDSDVKSPTFRLPWQCKTKRCQDGTDVAWLFEAWESSCSSRSFFAIWYNDASHQGIIRGCECAFQCNWKTKPLKTQNMCFYIAKKVNVLEHTRWVRFSTLERYCSSFHYLMFYILLCTTVHCTFKILHYTSMFHIVLCTAVHCTFNIVHDKSSTVHCLVYCLHNIMYCSTLYF